MIKGMKVLHQQTLPETKEDLLFKKKEKKRKKTLEKVNITAWIYIE